MTQKEIAKLLNVSQPTVSMALKGSERISLSLREEVRKLAAHSGYRPNLAGQLLRQGRSNVIGAMFPSLTNNFYAELFQELQRQLLPHGYLLYLSQVGTDGELEAAVECLRQMQVAGVIAIGNVAGRMVPMKGEGVALVFYGGDTELGLGVSQVLPDRCASAREMVRYLVGSGRRRIAFLGVKNQEEPRYRGYAEALREAGLEPHPVWAHERNDSLAAGCGLMRRLLDSGFRADAVFTHNDELAIGALRVALMEGLRVPEELAVCGFDNIETGSYLKPALTTVEQPRGEIASALIGELFATLADPAHSRFVSVPCRVVIRESA
ncbi:MAG: LacI family DNA-binding transcriptional regulator [Lentisphaeria bacterium]|nr:LacI family DNA-binding transcriptional regulator [Lentisphaeria bacterium]